MEGQTISGRWGKPGEVLLDLVVDDEGEVRGVANPGRQNAPIRTGHFNAASGVLHLEGEHVEPDGVAKAFQIVGRLDGRTLRLKYSFGELSGAIDLVRVEEYVPRPLSVGARLKYLLANIGRRINARSRPSGAENAKALRERGESVDSIKFREAAAGDIPGLAELHVTTWNATYRTSNGPTVATRTMQWTQVFARPLRRDFVLVLEDSAGRLIGFTWGKPADGGEFEGELSKIYLRFEYHGLGLGRRMMEETARRFLDREIHSFVLFSELTNPTLGFYDHLGGERLLNEHGRFDGGYAWRDVRTLIEP
jgi:GNAT superfamily N-acetyltransferase